MLYDLVGKELVSQPFPANQNSIVFEKGPLKPGVYLYRIIAGGQPLQNGKVAIQ
jgi:hypothetical protein